MSILHKEQSLLEIRAQRERESALQSATLYLFRHMAETGELEDGAIAAHTALFEFWEADGNHAEGCIRRCPENGAPHRCIASPNLGARTAKKPPSKTPDVWMRITEEKGGD